MGKFLNGLFVGIGIGLLIAPQTGEETRRLIMERVASLRKSVSSEDDQPISIDSHPPQITSFPAQPVQPAQPLATSSTQPQRQESTSTPPADTRATIGSQSVNTSSSNRTTTNTAQPAGLANARLAPGANLEQQASTEDNENTAKLPNLSKSNTSNTSNPNANRKASTGAQNTNKPRNNK
jgi:gas vesicle protein